MYFIEFLIKKFIKKNNPNTPDWDLEQKQIAEEEKCEHNFMPIDSTGEILSCTKCGVIRKRKELKNLNFFKD